MNDFNPLAVIAVCAGLVFAYILGWCNGSTFSKDENGKSENKSPEEREKEYRQSFEFMLNEEIGKVYGEGWNDCYRYYKFNMKPIYKDYYESRAKSK